MKLEVPEPLFLIAGFAIILVVIIAGHAPQKQQQQNAISGGNNAAIPAVATAPGTPPLPTGTRPHFEPIATIRIVTQENLSANKS